MLYSIIKKMKRVKEFKMKKSRIIALVAALSLTLGTAGVVSGCGNKSDSTSKASTASTASTVAYQYIPTADVLKVTDSHILDVREEENYKKGAVEGSEWQPIFPLEDTSLETAMKEYATSKLNDGKNIYIVCNSGKRGAEKTTGILIEAGIDKSKIFTVEGGAKALAEIDGALKPVQ